MTASVRGQVRTHGFATLRPVVVSVRRTEHITRLSGKHIKRGGGGGRENMIRKKEKHSYIYPGLDFISVHFRGEVVLHYINILLQMLLPQNSHI